MSTNDRGGVDRALVIGDGSWGTTLALRLARNGIETTIWSAFPEQAATMWRDRSNEAFLPGMAFPDNRHSTADPFSAADGVDLVVLPPERDRLFLPVVHRFQRSVPAAGPARMAPSSGGALVSCRGAKAARARRPLRGSAGSCRPAA